MKLIRAELVLFFAELDEDGEVGPISNPVQLTISGAEWNKEWSTDKSREAVANILSQLNGAKVG